MKSYMINNQDSRIKVQTMTRSEYMNAKHIPNALPCQLHRFEPASLYSQPKIKPVIKKPEVRRVEFGDEVIMRSHKPKVRETEKKSAASPQGLKSSSHQLMSENGRMASPNRQQPSPRLQHNTHVIFSPPSPKERGLPDLSDVDAKLSPFKTTAQPYPNKKVQSHPEQYDILSDNLRDELKKLRQENLVLKGKLDSCMEHGKLCEERYSSIKNEKEHYEKLYHQQQHRDDSAEKAAFWERRAHELQLELDKFRSESVVTDSTLAKLQAENTSLYQTKRRILEEVERLSQEKNDEVSKLGRGRVLELEAENLRISSQLEGFKTLLDQKSQEVETLSQKIFNSDCISSSDNQAKMHLLADHVLLAAEVERLHRIIQEIRENLKSESEAKMVCESKLIRLELEVSRLTQEFELKLNSQRDISSTSDKDVKIVLMAAEIERLNVDLKERDSELGMIKELRTERARDLKRSIDLEREKEKEDVAHESRALREKVDSLELQLILLQKEKQGFKGDYSDLELKYAALEKSYKVVLDALKSLKSSKENFISEDLEMRGSWDREKSDLMARVDELRYKNMRFEEMSILYMVEIERLHSYIEELVHTQKTSQES